jgi:hypothetical protein
MACLQHVDIDERRVVHDVGVVFTREDEPRPTHIGRKLIDLIEPTIDHATANRGVSQVAYEKVIGGRRRELGKFQIDPTHPKALASQTLDEMASDKSSSAKDQRRLLFCHVH